MTAVLLQDHSDAAQAIREISALSDEGYLPPQARASGLWTTVRSNFAQLQREHSDQLAADLDMLRPLLGNDANITLWLADGSGRIVRWSSHDRLYRRPENMRSVPVGHDSPWIAGQSLGRSDLLAKNLANEGSTRRWRSVVAAHAHQHYPEARR